MVYYIEKIKREKFIRVKLKQNVNDRAIQQDAKGLELE